MGGKTHEKGAKNMTRRKKITVSIDFAVLLDQTRRQMIIQTGKSQSMPQVTHMLAKKKKLI